VARPPSLIKQRGSDSAFSASAALLDIAVRAAQ
jgi:hypothetical protein